MSDNSQFSTLNSQFILLVEDDPRIQINNKKILEREGYVIKLAYTLKEAREIIAKEQPRAIILDVQLPDGSGFDFLRELRKTSTVPVLMLTAFDTPEDMMKGLRTGGDAYLTKPYDLSVFLTHLEALLRRSAIVPDALTFGPFKLVTSSNTAYLSGADMGLQQKEFALLSQFIQHPDTVISPEQLYKRVWEQDMAGDNQSLKKAVSKLRGKLENSGYTITAERNEGYIFERE